MIENRILPGDNKDTLRTLPDQSVDMCVTSPPLCGCPENGIVLDPFMGSGTTAVVALKLLRRYIGCDLNPKYIKIAEQRIAHECGLFEAAPV